MQDTIFAEATAPGRAGIAVVRISGPAAFPAVAALTSAPLPPRRAVLRRLRLPEVGTVIDDAIALAFPAPGSFTGEDTAELQCHGSRAVVTALLDALAARPGLRAALPGEFTRRALANGRLDLAQVEGLADLLAAETEVQRRQAMALADGRLSATAAAWREAIVAALARIEVSIDFADEDVPETVYAEARALIAEVEAAVAASLARSGAAERLRGGFEVALIGPPNVGKSSLLNAIAGRTVAITSPIPGTTRDVIELRTDLRGLPVTFLDTAGLRETDDPVEQAGVALACARAEAADLRVLLDDSPTCSATGSQTGDMVVRSKADRGPASGGCLAVSAKTGAGLDALLDGIYAALAVRVPREGAPSHRRQREALEAASAALVRARRLLEPPLAEPERAAADLQIALRQLDFLLGKVDVELVLDAVFATFCLGK